MRSAEYANLRERADPTALGALTGRQSEVDGEDLRERTT
jgi:hypothetical protein